MYGYEDKTYNEVLTQAVNNIEEINQAVDAICDEGYNEPLSCGNWMELMRWQAHYLISLRSNSTIPWYYKLQQN